MINRPVYLVAALDRNKSVRRLHCRMHLDYREAMKVKQGTAMARRPLVVKVSLKDVLLLAAKLLMLTAKFFDEVSPPDTRQEELGL